MGYYQITNVSASPYSSASLTLGAGLTTVMTADKLPPDLNSAIVAETLVVVKLTNGVGGGGSVDTSTQITEITTPASTSSQEICPFAASLLPPGRQVINNTDGDVAIRCSNSAASFLPSEYDEIIEPGEYVMIAADFTGKINAICESASGSILVRVFY